MQTQQIGTDISADVSFQFINLIAFNPTYQFKGRVDHDPLAIGVFDVTINRGEGIDLAHAEIVVHYKAPAGVQLLWRVSQLPDAPTGEIRFRVEFAAIGVIAGPTIAFVPTNPESGSITIRRKVPSN
jgi:hypothetical protein